MIGGPAHCFRLRPLETQLAEIKFVHEYVDDANRVVLGNIVLKTLREQRALRPIFTLNKALHQAYTSQRLADEVLDAHNNEMFQTATDYVFTQSPPIPAVPNAQKKQLQGGDFESADGLD
jgi:hypothetical protein